MNEREKTRNKKQKGGSKKGLASGKEAGRRRKRKAGFLGVREGWDKTTRINSGEVSRE